MADPLDQRYIAEIIDRAWRHGRELAGVVGLTPSDVKRLVTGGKAIPPALRPYWKDRKAFQLTKEGVGRLILGSKDYHSENLTPSTLDIIYDMWEYTVESAYWLELRTRAFETAALERRKKINEESERRAVAADKERRSRR